MRPTVPPRVAQYISEKYVQLRQAHKIQEENDKSYTYTSARTLLAVLRLSQALARLRFGSEVAQEDVDEALRLMDKSKESLRDADDEDSFEPQEALPVCTCRFRLFSLPQRNALLPHG